MPRTLLELADMVERGENVSNLMESIFNPDLYSYSIVNLAIQSANGSIDAIEKMREELLPDWLVSGYQASEYSNVNGRDRGAEITPLGYWMFTLEKSLCSENIEVTGRGGAEPAARLSALLRALHKERG